MDKEKLPIERDKIVKNTESVAGVEQQEIREQVRIAQRANLGLTYATFSAAHTARVDGTTLLQPSSVLKQREKAEEALQTMLHNATRMYQVWQNEYSLETGDWRSQLELLRQTGL
jgi:hypothetical protein